MAHGSSTRQNTRADSAVFLATFGAAWLALDRLGTSPPEPASALVALGAAGSIVIMGEAFMSRPSPRRLMERIGLQSATARAVAAALVVGGAVIATYVSGAALLGVHLDLRSHWRSTLVAALLFHGVGEELVWRGFVFGHFRRTHSQRRAVLLSLPLIALTHVPIIIGSGWLVGTLAVTTAASTCVPFSYLYQRGGRSIWPPAIVHGAIGTWQIFERTYPVQYQLVILVAGIVVPVSALFFGERFFTTAAPRLGRRHRRIATAMHAKS